MNIIKKVKSYLTMKKVLYFAYGSNLSTERMDGRLYHYKKMENYKLPHHTLKFNAGRETAFANVEDSLDNYVWGVLYEISFKDLKRLDVYEGHPFHYKRTSFFDSDYEKPIYYYKATEEYKTLAFPNIKYLRWIEKGLLEHGLPFPFCWKKIERIAIEKFNKENEKTI